MLGAGCGRLGRVSEDAGAAPGAGGYAGRGGVSDANPGDRAAEVREADAHGATGGAGGAGTGGGGGGAGGETTDGGGTGGGGAGGEATDSGGADRAGAGGAGGEDTDGASTGGGGTGGGGADGGAGGAGDAELPPAGVYGLWIRADGNHLIRFQIATPGLTEADVVLGGLAVDERMTGIAFHPLEHRLYGLANTSKIYRIDVESGAVSAVSASPFTPAIEPTPSEYANISFIPGVNLLRLANATGQNLRLDPTTGAAIADARLVFAVGGVFELPGIRATAYSGSGASAVLYAIDALTDSLMRSTDPDNGVLEIVGPLGRDIELGGLDIKGSPAVGYGALTDNGIGVTALYRIDLETGAMTSLGTIATPFGLLKSIAIFP
jgi:Domain of unknown function (DUF4394)